MKQEIPVVEADQRLTNARPVQIKFKDIEADLAVRNVTNMTALDLVEDETYAKDEISLFTMTACEDHPIDFKLPTRAILSQITTDKRRLSVGRSMENVPITIAETLLRNSTPAMLFLFGATTSLLTPERGLERSSQFLLKVSSTSRKICLLSSSR